VKLSECKTSHLKLITFYMLWAHVDIKQWIKQQLNACMA
jgi:hypothetical protein